MRAMERQYRLMYRLGLTPWDQPAIPPELLRLVEGPAALPRGTALDIGWEPGVMQPSSPSTGGR